MYRYLNVFETTNLQERLNLIAKIKTIRKKIFPLETFDCSLSDLNRIDLLKSLTEDESEYIVSKIDDYSLNLRKNILNKFKGTTFEEVIEEYSEMKLTGEYSKVDENYYSLSNNNFACCRLEDVLLEKILQVENFSNVAITNILAATFGSERVGTLYGKDYIANMDIDEIMCDVYDSEIAIEHVLKKYAIAYDEASFESIIVANNSKVPDDIAEDFINSNREYIKKRFELEASLVFCEDFDIECDDNGNVEIELMESYNMWNSHFIKFNVSLSESEENELARLFNQAPYAILADQYMDSYSELTYIKEDYEVSIALSEAYPEVGISPLFLIKLIEIFRKF